MAPEKETELEEVGSYSGAHTRRRWMQIRPSTTARNLQLMHREHVVLFDFYLKRNLGGHRDESVQQTRARGEAIVEVLATTSPQGMSRCWGFLGLAQSPAMRLGADVVRQMKR